VKAGSTESRKHYSQMIGSLSNSVSMMLVLPKMDLPVQLAIKAEQTVLVQAIRLVL
jgi:hypothetical protein